MKYRTQIWDANGADHKYTVQVKDRNKKTKTKMFFLYKKDMGAPLALSVFILARVLGARKSEAADDVRIFLVPTYTHIFSGLSSNFEIVIIENR